MIERILLLLLLSISAFSSDCIDQLDDLIDNKREALTITDHYRWLESKSEDRDTWIKRQAKRTVDYIKRAKSAKTYISNRLKSILGKQTVLKKFKLNDSNELRLVNLGLGKPNQLALYTDGKLKKVIVSNKTLTTDEVHANITKFYVSPDKQYVVVPVAFDGNIDYADYLVFGLDNFKLKEKLDDIDLNGFAWVGQHEFVYGKHINVDDIRLTHVIGDEMGDRVENTGSYFMNPIGNDYVLRAKGSKAFIRHVANPNEVEIKFDFQRIVGKTKTHFLFLAEDAEGFSIIKKVQYSLSANSGLSFGRVTELRIDDPLLFERAFVSGDRFFAMLKIGERRVFSFMGENFSDVELPDCCVVTGVKVLDKDQLELTMSSPIRKSEKFIYNVRTKEFDVDPSVKMLTDEDGREYVISYDQVESADGEFLPVRITHLKDIKYDGNNPALVHGYGGFGASGYLDPTYSSINLMFMQNGGVHVAPALRGGNEFGDEWADMAKFEGKQNTFNDMIATLEHLATSGISSPDKIATMGWSNGGLLTGATATQAPDKHKLAIVGNGVLDMFRKDELDAKFYKGWSYEYGTQRDPKHFRNLKKYSPVHNTKPGNYPTTLVVAGRDDSRVNPVHSYKFVAGLQDNQEGNNPIMLFHIPNAGHWPTSVDLQDVRAYQTLLGIWTTIFKELGVEIKHTGK